MDDDLDQPLQASKQKKVHEDLNKLWLIVKKIKVSEN